MGAASGNTSRALAAHLQCLASCLPSELPRRAPVVLFTLSVAEHALNLIVDAAPDLSFTWPANICRVVQFLDACGVRLHDTVPFPCLEVVAVDSDLLPAYIDALANVRPQFQRLCELALDQCYGTSLDIDHTECTLAQLQEFQEHFASTTAVWEAIVADDADYSTVSGEELAVAVASAEESVQLYADLRSSLAWLAAARLPVTLAADELVSNASSVRLPQVRKSIRTIGDRLGFPRLLVDRELPQALRTLLHFVRAKNGLFYMYFAREAAALRRKRGGALVNDARSVAEMLSSCVNACVVSLRDLLYKDEAPLSDLEAGDIESMVSDLSGRASNRVAMDLDSIAS
ncbi:MAG: hypothetical protein EOO65_06015, partial [Methanosarcinales archaeon]